jgi:propanol-preferring alcohol dehydrogenase
MPRVGTTTQVDKGEYQRSDETPGGSGGIAVKVEGYRIHQWGGDLHWESFNVGDPGPAEALVEVEACAIGLTVLNWMRGDIANDPELLPRVPGHEIVGRVRDVGDGVTSLSPGDRVVAYVYLSCGHCQPCRDGEDSMCRNLGGYLSVHCDGGYAPFVVLPSRNLLPLAESIPATQAAAIPDAIASPWHMVRTRAQVHVGDRVAVIGAGGGLGVHMIQIAQLLGAQVAGLEKEEAKLSMIAELGAKPIGVGSFDELDASRLWADGGPTVVVDLVGREESLSWGLGALAPGGRMVVLTTFRDVDFPVEPREMVIRQLSLLGSRYTSKAEVMEVSELVEDGLIRPVVTRIVSPEGVPDVHRSLRDGTLVGRAALEWGK